MKNRVHVEAAIHVRYQWNEDRTEWSITVEVPPGTFGEDVPRPFQTLMMMKVMADIIIPGDMANALRAVGAKSMEELGLVNIGAMTLRTTPPGQDETQN